MQSARRRLIPALAIALGACGKGAAAVPLAQKDNPGATTPVEAIKTIAANTDPCSWISAEEATRILGPLAGAPWRADNTENPEADPKGDACVYPLSPGPQGDNIAVSLVTEDAETVDAGFAFVVGKLQGDVGKGTADQVVGALKGDSVPQGWDFVQNLPGDYTARLGRIAVKIGMNGERARGDSVPRLAALLRDRIPDLPFATPRGYADHDSDGDPCALVTRAEAESILGTLTMPPYRSNGKKSGFVDPGGSGCSYYLGHHRILTMDMTWEQGKVVFSMSAGMTQRIFATAGVNASAADTLEGKWDQAGAGPAGSLYFLKGDEMLEITYIPAGVDQHAAVRLAKLAMARLK